VRGVRLVSLRAMEAPAITRYPRPFFAPLWMSLLAGAIVLAALGFAVYRSAGTTIVMLARTAEKDPGTIADPPLSPEGEERAQRLARLFGDGGAAAGLDAIYVSADRRAQQTAAPLGQRLHRTPIVFSDKEVAATASRLLHDHTGEAVLVIAGGASFAQMLRELGGGAVPAVQEDPDVVYVVSLPRFGRARLVRLRL
jgi:phosphohistidine phosphatase SixA